MEKSIGQLVSEILKDKKTNKFTNFSIGCCKLTNKLEPNKRKCTQKTVEFYGIRQKYRAAATGKKYKLQM